MKNKIRSLLWVAVLLALAGGAVWYFGFRKASQEEGVKPGVKYQCPMHPQIISDRHGDCPICNMRLVKIEEEPSQNGPSSHQSKGREVEGYAEMTIPAERQQLIGVKKERVRRKRLWHPIRAVGSVEVDETKHVIVTTKFGGWIEDLLVNYTGKFVEKGQILATIYSPDLVSTQEEYLLALKSLEQAQGEPGKETVALERMVNGTKERLRLWDISEEQIKALETARTPTKTLTIASPIKGYVIEKEAVKGKSIMPGEPLYHLADLSTVWVLAEVYEYEMAHVQEGAKAEVELSYFPGRVFQGTVTYVYPTVNMMTRTTKVRIELPNPDGQFRPGMFAKVRLLADMGMRLTIPEEAVMDTGTRQIVFVEKKAGVFEPREVRLGMKVERDYEVQAGVSDGETVVTSANFLLDSESRIRAAVKKADTPASGGGHTGHGGH